MDTIFYKLSCWDEIVSVCSQENNVETTREEIEVIFSGADKDGSGQLNIKEFLASSKAVNMVKEAENTPASKSSAQKRFESYKESVFNTKFLY